MALNIKPLSQPPVHAPLSRTISSLATGVCFIHILDNLNCRSEYKKVNKRIFLSGDRDKPIFDSSPQNFAVRDHISTLTPGKTNCPNKSIPNAEKRYREASADVLKGSRLVRVSANREERNDSGKDRGEDRRWWRSRKQSAGMGTLSKVNEQKDNVLAPNTTLSLSHSPAGGGLWEGGCQR